MATHAPIKTGFEKWQDGLGKAVVDSRWNAYDNELKTAVSEFNQHLKSTAVSGLVEPRKYGTGARF